MSCAFVPQKSCVSCQLRSLPLSQVSGTDAAYMHAVFAHFPVKGLLASWKPFRDQEAPVEQRAGQAGLVNQSKA